MTFPLDRAVVAHTNAQASNDPDAWDVAADAWDDYGAENDAGFCREMARLSRAGKNPRIVRVGDDIGIVHDEPASLTGSTDSKTGGAL